MNLNKYYSENQKTVEYLDDTTLKNLFSVFDVVTKQIVLLATF